MDFNSYSEYQRWKGWKSGKPTNYEPVPHAEVVEFLQPVRRLESRTLTGIPTFVGMTAEGKQNKKNGSHAELVSASHSPFGIADIARIPAKSVRE